MRNITNNISKKELLKTIAEGEHIVLLNILSQEEYLNEHIPGSINIPSDQIKQMAPRILNIDDKIIVYCDNFNNILSDRVTKDLIDLGYVNTYNYSAGLEDYKKSGEPLVGRLHEYYSDTDYYDAIEANDDYYDYLNYYKHSFR